MSNVLQNAVGDIIVPSSGIIVPASRGNNGNSGKLVVKQSKYMSESLVDSPIYDDEQMKAILDGIAQNIWQKMDAKGMTVRALADVAGTTGCNLSKIFNYKASIGLKTLIKVAYALGVSPTELFPYELNRRKTNGDRFEEITNNLDITSINYLLDQAAGLARLKYSHRG